MISSERCLSALGNFGDLNASTLRYRRVLDLDQSLWQGCASWAPCSAGVVHVGRLGFSFFVAWILSLALPSMRSHPENGYSAVLEESCDVLEQLVALRTLSENVLQPFLPRSSTMNNNNNNNNVNNNNNNNNASTKCPPSFCSSCHSKRSSQPPPIQVTAKVLFGSVTAISALNAERKKKS